jgi:4-amino-4-deoxy-L-arabinose transferase-like glycosyltransferase
VITPIKLKTRRWLLVGTLVVVVLLGFGLRVAALGWGLPYTEHPDEPSQTNRVLGMMRRDDWNPQFFGKPSLHYYLLKGVFTAHVLYGIATGTYTSLADLPQTTDQYLTTPDLFIWGRMLTVILGMVTVVVLFWVGRRWWDWRIGLLAAALLAFLPFHVRHSQYITQDVPSALPALLAVACALRLLTQPTLTWYALAGLCVGLAASTKYNAGAVVTSLVLAHFLAWDRAAWRAFWRLPWAAGWSLLGFLIGTPYVLLDFPSFADGVLRQYYAYSPPDSAVSGQTWPIASYLSSFWEEGLRETAAVAALIGMAVVVLRRDRPGLILLGFILPYPFLFLMQSTHYFRNMLPIIPPLLLLAAIGIVWLADWLWAQLTKIRPIWREKLWHPPLLIGAVLVAGWPLIKSVEIVQFYAQPHSKVRAAQFLRNELPQGAPMAVALHPVQWAGKPFVTPFSDVTVHDAAWYRAQGYRYVVVNPEESDSQQYQLLQSAARLVREFGGDQQGQPGPRLELFDLGVRLEQLAIVRRVAMFGESLQLLGYQSGGGASRSAFSPLVGITQVAPGESLLLNLYWQTQAALDTDYALFVHVRDKSGNIVAQRDTILRQSDYPSSRWQPGEVVVEIADLPLRADLAPGEYQVIAGVYSMETMERLPARGSPDGAVNVMTLEVARE